ncbi:ABC-type transport system substrate-binding protein [Actinopolymorpha rutila]|uniref:ABC-type transport system substrate-binding protein n=1 Tax=Actinopolymorpha rutila TaxID=446787 RepID=A0A852ZGV9_9ACTN|nr:ABC-type transport system substrate-binding protein [Actinopolymorpha rutila]
MTSTSACDLLSTDPTARKGGGKEGQDSSGTSAKEAPGLAQQVMEGKLPPLADRIPKIPLVVRPVERTGSYGGTWRSALLGPSDTAWLGRTVGYEALLRWDSGWTKAVPDIAESFQVSPDAREFTFRLRAGMRWSDGKPFTAADVVFAVDVLSDPVLYPAGLPLYLTTGKGPAKASRVDDQTVRLSFPEPSGLLIDNLAFQGALTAMPRHYLQRFHRKSNPEVAALAKKEKFQDWVAMFLSRADHWANSDLPTLCAWKVVNPVGEGGRVIVERNPYYWKTDPEGRQLPYLDRVVFDVIADASVILLKATNGEFDMHTRHVNTSPNKPVLARGRGKGHFHFVDVEPCFENQMVIALNLTHEDPELRKVFQNRDFRIGLSYAINRPELVNAVFQRQGRAWQAAPRGVALLRRGVRHPVHPVRRDEGQRDPGPGRVRQAGHRGVPAATGRAAHRVCRGGGVAGRHSVLAGSDGDGPVVLAEGRHQDVGQAGGPVALLRTQGREQAGRHRVDGVGRTGVRRTPRSAVVLPVQQRVELRDPVGHLVQQPRQGRRAPTGGHPAADGALSATAANA